MIRAAGILFVTPEGKALFLQRGPGGDWPGAWCFPGGTTEGDETAEETATREATEELGFLPEGERTYWTRRAAIDPVLIPGDPNAAPAQALAEAVPEEVDFTTFLQRAPAEFEPKLNGEHTGWAWAPVDNPPAPLHPGCHIALARVGMNELDIARAIAAGELTSPQQYMNISLLAIRITGTAASYRPQLNEYVYRRPENYLTEEFLARCNGLPVIVQHPKGDTLDGKEFGDRIIGTVFLPYIRGDEVWAVAKIFNEAAAEAMATTQLSTSPGIVVATPPGSTLKTEDGSTLLIEGGAKLVDHIAIVPLGVWDKGGDAAGVESIEVRKDSVMTDEERAKKDADEKAEKERADAARKDADDNMAKLMTGIDAVMKACDAMGGRMDAMGARMDAMEKGAPEMTAADKAKKDAEEAEEKAKKDAAEKEEKERMDAARKDAVSPERIAALEAAVRGRSDADNTVIASAWHAANEIMTAFGDSATQALQGELPLAYRRRLLLPMQVHSQTWKGVDLATLGEEAFSIAETQIRKDAMASALSPSSVGEAGLRMITKRLPTGHIVNEFIGTPGAWLQPMAGPVRKYIQGGQQGFKVPNNRSVH